jgi:hypothetical protein
MSDDEIKALITAAAKALFDDFVSVVEPIQAASRAIQLEVLGLRLATFHLAGIVAERVPDGPALLQLWLQRLIAATNSVSLNDENNQPLPPELDAQIRAEIRKQFEDFASRITP